MTDHKYVISGASLPNWSNPISHAVVANDMCFVSGQLSVNLDGLYVPGSIGEEAHRSFENFFAVIAAADFCQEDIVFVDVALVDMNAMADINDLYMTLFPEGKRPARTIYQVAALPFGGKVKVMGTAVKRREDQADR